MNENVNGIALEVSKHIEILAINSKHEEIVLVQIIAQTVPDTLHYSVKVILVGIED